jgi:hypothetical protein
MQTGSDIAHYHSKRTIETVARERDDLKIILRRFTEAVDAMVSQLNKNPGRLDLSFLKGDMESVTLWIREVC